MKTGKDYCYWFLANGSGNCPSSSGFQPLMEWQCGSSVCMALIAFAAVSFRGVIERALFYETISLALTAGCLFLGLGLIVCKLAKRTYEELAKNDLDQMMGIQNDERPAAAPSITPTKQH